MLAYTGHPFVDVGIATVTAFAGKADPATLEPADLAAMADYIEENYTRNPLRSFLTVAFTSNSWFAQDAYNPDKQGLAKEEREARRESRKKWADRHLRAWVDDAMVDDGTTCVFTGSPAISAMLSGKLPAGRAGRAQIPLLQGDDNINFYPGGDTGIPISGAALLCLQAFPLGCAKVVGSLLVIHADDNRLTFRFARRHLDQNRRDISVAHLSNADKMPEIKHSLGTYLIGTLLELERERADAVKDGDVPASITAYHLNNGRTPKIDIYHVPLEVTGFLQLVTAASYRAQWDALVAHAWQRPPAKTGKTKTDPADFEPRRNYLYEDILSLPDGAARFIRLYFLRSALRRAHDDDPRRDYSPVDDASLITWDLTQLFLKGVLHMDSGRINAIRDLGDRCADYIQSENDRRFFRTFLTEKRYAPLRLALIRADADAVRRGQGPLITFDQFIEVFEDGEDVARIDWALARDLVLIRMIERLHTNGWLRQNVEDLRAELSTDEANSEDGVATATR